MARATALLHYPLALSLYICPHTHVLPTAHELKFPVSINRSSFNEGFERKVLLWIIMLHCMTSISTSFKFQSNMRGGKSQDWDRDVGEGGRASIKFKIALRLHEWWHVICIERRGYDVRTLYATIRGQENENTTQVNLGFMRDRQTDSLMSDQLY